MGSLPNFHPLYYLYLQEGDCHNTKEHYFAKDAPEHVVFLLFPLCSRGYRPTKFKISPQSLFFTEDVVEAEVSPDEDPLRLPSLPLTQTTHRLATEHLQVITMSNCANVHADVGHDDYIDGDGDCAKNIGICTGEIFEKDCG